MSETNQNDVIVTPPTTEKKGRGRPIGTTNSGPKKVDDNYFKRYYLEKTKLKNEKLEKYKCPHCGKVLSALSIKAHENSKYCQLMRE